MNVVLIGATGMIGSRVLNELLSRGHHVKALVRDPARLAPRPNLEVARGDIFRADDVAQVAAGADAVISAYGPGAHNDAVGKLHDAMQGLMTGLARSGARRVIVVGGAGSLFVAPGLQLVDAPNFPEVWKAIALAHRDALESLRKSDLDWTYLCPAAEIAPGERTGKFRVGADLLLTDASGHSRISVEDYAIALVDELEQGKHIRKRFTVAY
jgi:uncharacterized protein